MGILIQYIIIFLVIALAVTFAVRGIYKSINQNIKCKDYKCAGCAFYDKCKKEQKKQ